MKQKYLDNFKHKVWVKFKLLLLTLANKLNKKLNFFKLALRKKIMLEVILLLRLSIAIQIIQVRVHIKKETQHLRL